MLSFNPIAGPISVKSFPIAKDGRDKIYYIDSSRNLLDNMSDEAAEEEVMDLVDKAVDKMRISSLSTPKLIAVDNDILSGEAPRGRYETKIYAEVKDKLGKREHKFYRTQTRKLIPIPRNIPGQTDRLFVSGQSGSGKSYFTAMYAKAYLEQFPQSIVYLISRCNYDPAFDEQILNLVRIPLNRQFITKYGKDSARRLQRKRDIKQRREKDEEEPKSEEENCDLLREFASSLVIFDDFIDIPDAALKVAVIHLKNDMLSMGRKLDIDVISIQQASLGGNDSKKELLQSTSVVVFPKTNVRQVRELFKKYLCYDSVDIKRVLDDEGKQADWMCIIKAQNIIITPNYIKIL